MVKKLRTFQCADCGATVTRTRRSYDPSICTDCGIARAVKAASDMFARQGPAWEAHRRNPGGRRKAPPPPTE